MPQLLYKAVYQIRARVQTVPEVYQESVGDISNGKNNLWFEREKGA